MKTLLSVLYAEIIKILKSKVFFGTLAAFALAPIMGSLFVIVLRNPELSGANGALQAKASLTGFTPNWPGFFNLIGQAVGVGGVILFGFVASWIFGREFSDHTAKELMTLPLSRNMIIGGKMAAMILWCLLLTAAVIMLALFCGTILQLTDWSWPGFLHALKSIAFITLLTLLLSTPVTFIATVGKGYLAPLAFVVLSVILAQIIGALGFGGFFPWAVPAIYSKVVGTDTPLNFISYLILMLTSLAGIVSTLLWWNLADQSS